MARKKKNNPEGAPDWLVTYGDMMTLLLCFFVILVSLSEIKKDQKFQDVIESIKKAFGYQGGVGWVTGQISPTNTNDMRKQRLIMRKFQLQIGKSADEGIEGENPSVKTIREGHEYTIGGMISFERGRAQLLEPARKHLAEFCNHFRGMNTKVRIRGHASRKKAEHYRPFKSIDDLAYHRALAVKQFLIKQGIREERITVEACGDNEPIVIQAVKEEDQARNRRVSIIITDNLVDQFQGQPGSDADTNDIILDD